MSPLGEAYRRARQRQDSTGDRQARESAPGEAQGGAVGPGGAEARPAFSRAPAEPDARNGLAHQANGPASSRAPAEPDTSGPAAVGRQSAMQAFAPAGSLPQQGGGGLEAQAAARPSSRRGGQAPKFTRQGGSASTELADDLLLRASRVPAFAEGPLRPGCDELAGLKAALFAAGLDRPPVSVLVTSPASGAGTTAVAVGLAGELARDLSRRVILVDADVHSPGVAGALGVDAGYDLADVLDVRADAGEAIIHSEVDNLSALVVRPNPMTGVARITAESLARPAANEVFGLIESAFDYVVIDAGAVEESASAAVLAARASGIVLVLPVGVTRTRARSARSAVESAGGRVLGVVLTGVRG